MADLLDFAAELELHVPRLTAMPAKRFVLTFLAALLVCATIAAEQNAQPPAGGAPDGGPVTLVGRVLQVHGPRVLSVENRLSEEQRLLVLLPDGASAPAAGRVVSARGPLRRLDQAQLANRPWTELDPEVRGSMAGRRVLLAESFETPDATADAATDLPRQPLPVRTHSTTRRQVTVRPASLADFIGELAGSDVVITPARVVGLFDARAFLIDSALRYQPALGERDRILVIVRDGALRVPAETLVASTVTVAGVARSLLGMQTGGDVTWPPQLDRETIKRLEVRAAVLATSVHTAEGIELTDRAR